MIGGADGCRTGWVVCRRDAKGVLDVRVVKTLAEACEGLSILAVDMPIGFVDHPRPPRACEVEARKLLPGKASSVFPTPCRPALACTTHAEANALSKALGVGVNQQTFHLFPAHNGAKQFYIDLALGLKYVYFEATFRPGINLWPGNGSFCLARNWT